MSTFGMVPRTRFTSRVMLLVVLTFLGWMVPGQAAQGMAAPSSQGRATAALPLPAQLAWGWPLAPVPRLIHGFDPPAQPWLGGHRGVDLLAIDGAEVVAPTAGTVSFAGWVVDRPVLSLDLPNGLRLTFEPVESTLKPGAAVIRGDVLGRLHGKTHCDGGSPGADSCLHWGVRRGDVYLDPLQFILDLRPSVLLPLDD